MNKQLVLLAIADLIAISGPPPPEDLLDWMDIVDDGSDDEDESPEEQHARMFQRVRDAIKEIESV